MEENTPTTVKKEREIGFELLRIMSILLIICHHFLLHGECLTYVGGGIIKQ